MTRILKLLIILPIAAVIVAFAMANRQSVTISFDPFTAPEASSSVITAPLFLLLFLVLLVGTFLGGVAHWLSQGASRRRARIARDEAERWRSEARRLREQPPIVVPTTARQLARTGV